MQKLLQLGLSNLDVKIEERDFSDFSLFVPDSIIYESTPINITINTEKGDIGIELWPKDSPLTVSHFIYLIRKNYYKNLTFHRVVSDFVIQGGDPTGTGWGGPGYVIPCEYNDKPFMVMGVGLARGLEAVNYRIIFQIMIYWVLTVPASAIISMIIYKIIRIYY